MKKKFTLKKDHLEVVVKHNDKLFLPDQERTIIGSFNQTTTQKIDLNKIDYFKGFIESQKDNAESQLETLNKELAELGDVQMIDLEVVEACKKQINKGSKSFKQKMTALNLHIEKVMRKDQLTKRIEYLSKQLEEINKDYDDLLKVLK